MNDAAACPECFVDHLPGTMVYSYGLCKKCYFNTEVHKKHRVLAEIQAKFPDGPDCRPTPLITNDNVAADLDPNAFLKAHKSACSMTWQEEVRRHQEDEKFQAEQQAKFQEEMQQADLAMQVRFNPMSEAQAKNLRQVFMKTSLDDLLGMSNEELAS